MKHQDYIDEIAAGAKGPPGGWSPRAFDCQACPGASCPAWWSEKWQRDGEDGVRESRVVEGCGFRLAQAMFVRTLVGVETQQAVLESRTEQIEKRQKKVQEILVYLFKLAAKASGNPVAIQVAPRIPKAIGGARRLLSMVKKRSR